MILISSKLIGQWALSHNYTLEGISKNLGTVTVLPDGFFGRLTNE